METTKHIFNPFADMAQQLVKLRWVLVGLIGTLDRPYPIAGCGLNVGLPYLTQKAFVAKDVTIVNPPPPPAPRCADINFEPTASIRASVPDAYRYGMFCHVIVQDSQYLVWYGSPLTNAGEVGVQSALDQHVTQAVDVFNPTGIIWFEGGAVVCLRGTGNLFFLAGSQAPVFQSPL